MPILATLATIASIAAAGTTIGTEIAGATGGGGGQPQTPATPKPTPPDANTLALLRQRIGSADANTQTQTAGTAGDDFRRFIDQLVAGTTGQPGSAGAAASTVYGPQQAFQPANSQVTNAVDGRDIRLTDYKDLFGS